MTLHAKPVTEVPDVAIDDNPYLHCSRRDFIEIEPTNTLFKSDMLSVFTDPNVLKQAVDTFSLEDPNGDGYIWNDVAVRDWFFKDSIRDIQAKAQGWTLSLPHVLITGALDFVVEPLRPLFDDVVCAQLGNDGVTYDGQLTSVPPTGEARYQALADLADEHGYDLRESIAYADSASDLPMLEAVGFPVAVNPETRLASIARKRGWLVEDFRKSPGMTRRLLPLAPPQTAIR